MTQDRWRVQCFGRVQHVGFRYTAMYLAKELSLTGWVRNLHDGSVLLEVQGGTSQLRQFLIRLKSRDHIHIGKYTLTVIPLQPYEHVFKVY